MIQTKKKLLIEFLDVICRKNKKIYREYCHFIINKSNYKNNYDKKISCSKKILKLIIKNQDIKKLKLRDIFFGKKYKSFEELIEKAFKYSKVKNTDNLTFLEVGFFIIRFMINLEKNMKKSKKGKTIER